MAIRSGDMCGARSGCKPLPVSLEVCPQGARTSDVFRSPTAARTRSGLAAPKNGKRRMLLRRSPFGREIMRKGKKKGRYSPSPVEGEKSEGVV